MTTSKSSSTPKHLLLAGGGHAHIGLLRKLAKNTLLDTDNVTVTLLSDTPHTLYSGMVPGWMAEHYRLDEMTINVKALCQRAKVRFIKGALIGVNANAKVATTTKDKIAYDILSLNTGADTDLSWLPVLSKKSDAVIAIRPLSSFIQYWQQIVKTAKQSVNYRLAVVGSGAAAVELVMAAQVALQRINPNHQAYLICGEQLLSGFDDKFRRRVIRQLNRLDIKVVYERAMDYKQGHLLTQTQNQNQSLAADAVIAATGIMSAEWTARTDLQTVDHGFIAVNSHQQSTSHANVFAVGDVATRVDKNIAHSGVHAVHGGAVTANNILAYLKGEALKKYQPASRTLYLLSCGDKYAIASFGRYSLEGRWVWYLKRYIDKRFVKG